MSGRRIVAPDHNQVAFGDLPGSLYAQRFYPALQPCDALRLYLPTVMQTAGGADR